MGLLLWFPNQILTRLFRPLENLFDEMHADAEYLIRVWEEAQNK